MNTTYKNTWATLTRQLTEEEKAIANVIVNNGRLKGTSHVYKLAVNLTLDSKACQEACRGLGIDISEEGIESLKDKLQAIQKALIRLPIDDQLEIEKEVFGGDTITIPEYDTISKILKAYDCRCARQIRTWYARPLSRDFLRTADLTQGDKVVWPIRSLNSGDDYEFDEGQSILELEAVHPYKQRGYIIILWIALRGDLLMINSLAATKQLIKSLATPDQWRQLKDGSGKVAGCVRIAKALELFRGGAKEILIQHLVDLDDDDQPVEKNVPEKE